MRLNLLPATTVSDGRDAIDLVAIRRAMGGDTVRLTKADKRYAARMMRSDGLGPGTIAHRLGISASTTSYYLAGEQCDG